MTNPTDTEMLKKAVQTMDPKHGGMHHRAQMQAKPGKTSSMTGKPHERAVYHCMQHALNPITKQATDETCSHMSVTAMAAEPECGQVYNHFANGLTDPRVWVQQVQALHVIEAEVSVDTIFDQIGMPKPSRLLMRAAVYVYIKSLFWDYMRSMKEFNDA